MVKPYEDLSRYSLLDRELARKVFMLTGKTDMDWIRLTDIQKARIIYMLLETGRYLAEQRKVE